jgi:hypothetical protein
MPRAVPRLWGSAVRNHQLENPADSYHSPESDSFAGKCDHIPKIGYFWRLGVGMPLRSSEATPDKGQPYHLQPGSPLHALAGLLKGESPMQMIIMPKRVERMSKLPNHTHLPQFECWGQPKTCLQLQPLCGGAPNVGFLGTQAMVFYTLLADTFVEGLHGDPSGIKPAV